MATGSLKLAVAVIVLATASMQSCHAINCAFSTYEGSVNWTDITSRDWYARGYIGPTIFAVPTTVKFTIQDGTGLQVEIWRNTIDNCEAVNPTLYSWNSTHRYVYNTAFAPYKDLLSFVPVGNHTLYVFKEFKVVTTTSEITVFQDLLILSKYRLQTEPLVNAISSALTNTYCSEYNAIVEVVTINGDYPSDVC